MLGFVYFDTGVGQQVNSLSACFTSVWQLCCTHGAI